MDRLSRIALLTELIGKLEPRSWCGETHVQKTVYFLQELLGVPLEFNFILYKHGPFSFELRDELAALRADNMLTLISMPAPYGPSLKATPSSAELRLHFPNILGKYSREIELVAQTLGAKDAGQLERLATALYVILNPDGEVTDEERAERIHGYKPHVSTESALHALHEVSEIVDKAKRLDEAA